MSKRLICFILAAVIVIATAAFASPDVYAARNYVLFDENIKHGKIETYNSPNLNNRSIDDNTVIHMIAVPDEGYDLKEWNVRYSDGTQIEVQREDPSSVSMQYHYYFKIPKRTSNYRKTFYIYIGAVFEQNVSKRVAVSYTDISNRGSKIVIDRKDGMYAPGETVTVTANLERGTKMIKGASLAEASYYIENGKSIYFKDFPDYTEVDDHTWTFTMPKSDVSLICRFEIDRDQLRKVLTDSATSDMGSIKPSVTEAVPGDTVKVKIEPFDAYECMGVTVVDDNGAEISLDADGAFIMPNVNVTISAKYKKKYISRRISFTDGDTTEDLFYSDEYFSHPSTEYDSHLATLSVYMAKYSMNPGGPGTVDNREWYENQSNRVENFFKAIGFGDFDANKDYKSRTDFDTIGIAVASKKIGDYTVIAVVPRSGGYFREWSNNIWLGDGTKSDYMHEGWFNAANKMFGFLTYYIEEHKITGKVKLWMAGFSRGGAVTNLAAGMLDNTLGSGDPKRLDNENPEGTKNNPLSENITLTRADLYAYTFEAPQGANINSKTVKPPKDDIYSNIWNIVNPNDLVPKVAMSEWGFTRFGTDKYITTEFFDKEGYSDARKSFFALYGVNNTASDYNADSFTMYGITGSKDHTKWNYDSNITSIRVLESIVMAVGTRERYCLNYQSLLKDMMLKVMNDVGDDSTMDRAIDFAKGLIAPTLTKVAVANSPLAGDINEHTEYFADTAIPLTAAGVYLAILIPSETYSFYANIGNVFRNHDTNVCVSHMQSMDSYYTEAYNDAHPNNKINTVALRDNADLGRVTFWGYNDLILNGTDGTTFVSVKGKDIGKSTVWLCETGYAFGYYSYMTDESMELFFPVNRNYNLTVKSYSNEMNNKIQYTVYCQYNSIGANGEYKKKIAYYKGESWFDSDSDYINLNVIP